MDMWSGLCRCCLTSNCEIELTDSELNLKEKFLEVTSIEVKPEDGLPQNLCSNCLDLLNSAYQFRKKCIKMNNELQTHLQKFLERNRKSFIECKEDADMEDFGNDPTKQLDAIIKHEPIENDIMKQLETLIKQEPSDDDTDDDYYYVVVVDPKEQEDIDSIEDNATDKYQPIINDATEQITPIPNGHFESSLGSYVISDKVSPNVPATILENEESQDNDDDHFDSVMNIVETQDNNELGSENEENIIFAFEEDKSNECQLDTITGEFHELPKKPNNLVKILTTTRADGTIVLKSNDKITYLTDTQLVTNDVDDDQDPMSHSEVILCEGDDSSQFQILKCDGNELVIEYADDSQIATVLQQEDGTFLCECGATFVDLTDYEQHQSTHNPAGDYLCNMCGKGFESAEILTGHTLLHNVSGLSVMCPYCGQLLKRHSLTQHIKYSHCDTKPQCTTCFKTFANPNNLKRHMMIHSGIREFECDICNKRFHQKITMQTHRLTHVNPLACHLCDEVFTSTTDLKAHKESNLCTKSKFVKAKDDLMKTAKREISTDTGKIVGYACSLCQKIFSLPTALEQHFESVHLENPMELLCIECGEVFLTRIELQKHLQTHKIFNTKSNKRFVCNTCGKACTSQAMLIMHERVHTNERPFACQLCTLRFKTKTHLRTHQLTHTREKKFGCSICMKFFALKGNLVVHLRTHTGERPYTCSLCGEAFIDSKYLKKHKLKKHSIENVPWHQY